MTHTDKMPLDKLEERKPHFDAKGYLERTLPRKVSDLLKIFPMQVRDAYRVNWYNTKPSEETTIPGLGVTHIRESKFLFCRLDADGNPEITYPNRQ